jgi:hypothetical protein
MQNQIKSRILKNVIEKIHQIVESKLDVVVHVCNTRYFLGDGSRHITSLRSAQAKLAKPYLKNK